MPAMKSNCKRGLVATRQLRRRLFLRQLDLQTQERR
jgi:hypothetical protein